MSNAKERKDELVLAALLSNPTVRAAATACQMSETQIYARLRTPAFKERYDNARRELLAQSTAYLQAITGEALQKMYEIMKNPDVAPQVQLNAAQAIASNSLKMTEQADILATLAELKKVVFLNE